MTKVFISYSRKDKAFASRLTEALEKSELETWIDWEDIPPTADWLDQIHKGIEEADGFLFLLSPDSVASKVCGQEVDHAVQNGKRLIPIVAHEINPDDVHPALGKVNWIYCRESDDFDDAVNKTLSAIRTDLVWVEAHKRLQVRAIEWDKRMDGSLLLRGKDLREAEEQLASAGQKDPQPTDLQRQYLLESRRREIKTRNRLLTISSMATLLLVALFILALIQLNKSRSLVLSSQAQSAFSEENYNVAALYAYQSNRTYANETASLVLGELPFKNYPIGKALLGHYDSVESVAWSQDGRLASGSRDNSVILWDIETRQPLKILRGHSHPVGSIAWSQDGRLASSAWDEIIVWDPATGESIQTIKYDQDTGSYGVHLINSINWSLDGRLASGSYDGNVIIWDLKTGQPAQILSGHTGYVNSIAWSQDGKLASGSDDGNVIIWDLKTGQPAQILSIYTGFVNSVAWSQDGRLASGSSDNEVIIWDLTGGQPAQILSGHTNLVKSIAWSRDGKLASGSGDTTIMLWEPGKQEFTQELSGYTNNRDVLAWAEDGKLASGSDNGKVIIWDLQTGTPGQILSGHTDSVRSLAWSHDGRLASGSDDGKVIIWDLKNGQSEQVLSGHSGRILSVVWSHDGKLASGSGDKTIIIWDLETGKPEQVLSGHSDRVESVAWSHDGSLASGSDDGKVIIWDLETGQPERVLSGHRDSVYGIDWSYDGRLASGSQDGKIIIWDLETGRPAQILSGEVSWVSGMDWSQDGKLASSAARDWAPAGRTPSTSTIERIVIIWDPKTGEPIKTIRHSGWLGDAAWSPDGRLTVINSGTIYILRGDLLNNTCEKWLSRNMSIDEWLVYQGTFFVYKPACPNLPLPDFRFSMSDLREKPSYTMNVALITWQGRIIIVGILVIILAILYGTTRVFIKSTFGHEEKPEYDKK